MILLVTLSWTMISSSMKWNEAHTYSSFAYIFLRESSHWNIFGQLIWSQFADIYSDLCVVVVRYQSHILTWSLRCKILLIYVLILGSLWLLRSCENRWMNKSMKSENMISVDFFLTNKVHRVTAWFSCQSSCLCKTIGNISSCWKKQMN